MHKRDDETIREVAIYCGITEELTEHDLATAHRVCCKATDYEDRLVQFFNI